MTAMGEDELATALTLPVLLLSRFSFEGFWQKKNEIVKAAATPIIDQQRRLQFEEKKTAKPIEELNMLKSKTGKTTS